MASPSRVSQEDDGFMDGMCEEVMNGAAVREDVESILQNHMTTNPFDDWEKDAHRNFDELFQVKQK